MLMGEYIRQVHPVSFAQSSEVRAVGISSNSFSGKQRLDRTTTDRPHSDNERATKVPIKDSNSLRSGQVKTGGKGRPVETDLVPSESLESRDSPDPYGLIDVSMDVPQDSGKTLSNEISLCVPTPEYTPTQASGADSWLLNVESSSTTSDSTSSNKSVASEPLIYAKDLTCPNTWREYLEGFLPKWLVYMAGNDLMSKSSIALYDYTF